MATSSIEPHALKTNDSFVARFILTISVTHYESTNIKNQNGVKVVFETNAKDDYDTFKLFDTNNLLETQIKRYTENLYRAMTIIRSSGNNSGLKLKAGKDFIPSASTTSSDVSDSTLEGSGDEDFQDHYLDEETDEYEIEPLVSNETLADEFRKKCTEISDESKTASNSNTGDFIENVDNLRHNEEEINVHKLHHQLRQVESPFKNSSPFSCSSPPSSNYHLDQLHLDDLKEVLFEEDEEEGGSYFEAYSKERLSRHSSPIKQYEKDDETIAFLRKPPFLSPTKTRKSISRMSSAHSVSLINDDDEYGLEYAYNANGENVPSYIKQNKKFKFIKVGKVQKFVNLFEEQNQKLASDNSNPASRNTSRVSSRPSTRPSTRPSSPSRTESTNNMS